MKPTLTHEEDMEIQRIFEGRDATARQPATNMKTIIPINDKYRIELNSHSWVIAQWIPNKKNPEKSAYRQKIWCRTLSDACKALLERDLAESELVDVSQIISRLQATGELIAASIRESGYKDSYSANK